MSSKRAGRRSKAAIADEWEQKYEALVDFFIDHGHVMVPMSHPELGEWVVQQRLFANHKLSPQQIERLDVLGFAWTMNGSNNNNNNNAVVTDHNQDEMRFAVNGKHENNSLIAMSSSEKVEAEETMDVEEVRDVEGAQSESEDEDTSTDTEEDDESDGEEDDDEDDDEYDFDSDSVGNTDDENEVWMELYERLQNYKMDHGNTNVPKDYVDNHLAEFVHYHKANEDVLDLEKYVLLQKLGFFGADHWEAQFQKLVQHQAMHGTTDVPQIYEPDQSLANWVHYQRYRDRNGIMGDDERARLDEIGFEWIDSSWNRNFEALKSFHKNYGHCHGKPTRRFPWLSH
jgi:hypothetical protein